MKKIFTLVAGVLFAAAVMAADHRPVVTVKSMKSYKIVIDGKSYFGNDLTIALDNFSGYGGGRHTIKVFEMKRGLFIKGEKLVGASSFQSGRNDVAIAIDRFGQISIREKKNNNDWNDRDHDRRNNRGNRF